jgi:Ser/Thr protein kinase RdoA (MazF antagonist)
MMQFSELLPRVIFETVTRQGFRPTGVLFPLNSYENRVYEIGIEGQNPLVGKYYRPGRWSAKAIAEEHAFLEALAEHEIPVVPSLKLREHLPECEALASTGEIYYAFYPKFRGREHAEITLDDLKWLGRTLGRLHNIGAKFKAPHRIALNPQSYGYESLDYILTLPFVPSDLLKNIEIYLRQALDKLEPFFASKMETILVHGDCHPGNLLWNPEGPHLLDFDDMLHAPPVQDIWMLFYGTEEEMMRQKEAFFSGYEIFREFDYSTLRLAEPLRTLRMIRHTAWIGKRHQEPIFQKSFPYYRERRYWEDFLLSMKEQIALLQES